MEREPGRAETKGGRREIRNEETTKTEEVQRVLMLS